MIFISYSHKDRELCEALVRMSAPLLRYGGTRLWTDADIPVGKDWKQEINKALDATSVAVLLVSDAFLQSPFIQKVEFPYFQAAARKRGVEFLWVLATACYWERTPLKDIQAASNTDKPLDSLSPSQQKSALKEIVKKIDAAWQRHERPCIDSGLQNRKVNREEPSLQILAQGARRRTEIFVRAERSNYWWHQDSIMPGKKHGKCCFGDAKTKSGHPYKIVAMTTDEKAGGKSEKLPIHRTKSCEVTVIRN